MRKENENKINQNLNIFSQGNVNFIENFPEVKNKKINIPQLGKKRKRIFFTNKFNDNLEAFDENEFNNIKSNNNKQNERNIHQKNKNSIINEEENSANISASNNNIEKKNNNKIQIEKYQCAFDLNEGNEIQQKNIGFNFISLWDNIMKIEDISNEIENTMKELKIDKKSIDTYNKLHLDILTNKMAIKHLNILINFLSNLNIINLKRKIAEVFLFELFKNNEESFELLNYKPTKPNIEELKNLIYIKLKKNNEKYKKEIERLVELINKNYNNNNADPYINIIEKNRKKRAQINMIFQFLKFCKKDLNPFVHASGEKINFYLLPKNCINNNADDVKYFFSLDDILLKEINSNEKKQNLTEMNISNDLDIYTQKKFLPVNEALDLLLSKKKIFNFLNDNFSNEIKKKQIVLSESLKIFDKKFNIFSGIGIKLNSITNKIPKLKNDLINANSEFIKLLDLLDLIISDILKSNEFDEEISNNIELIKKCINIDICSRIDIVEKIEKVNPEKGNYFIYFKLYRLCKILDFLKKQKEKIIQYHKSLYEENEKYYNEIIDKVQTLSDLVNRKYNIKNESLFDKWKESGPRIKNKFCKIEILRQNFIDLIINIELDMSYSYDEKFVLWSIKNNFDNYFLN